MKRGFFNNKKAQIKELPPWAVFLIVLVIFFISAGIFYKYGAATIDYIKTLLFGR